MPPEPKAPSPKLIVTDGKPMPSQLRFKYLIDNAYAPHYANGAHGSTTPHGELVLSFFLERSPVPLSDTKKISADGELQSGAEKVETEREELLILRQITTGVVMSVETATRVHALLGQLLSGVKEATEAAKK